MSPVAHAVFKERQMFIGWLCRPYGANDDSFCFLCKFHRVRTLEESRLSHVLGKCYLSTLGYFAYRWYVIHIFILYEFQTCAMQVSRIRAVTMRLRTDIDSKLMYITSLC